MTGSTRVAQPALGGGRCRDPLQRACEIRVRNHPATTFLKGKQQGKTTRETIIYLCTLPPDAARSEEMLGRIRNYWEIESGLHQRLDVTAAEDASRVRNRNGLLVLGLLRRCAIGIYYDWRRGRKSQRQSTLKDFYDDMHRFNNRKAFATITSPRR